MRTSNICPADNAVDFKLFNLVISSTEVLKRLEIAYSVSPAETLYCVVPGVVGAVLSVLVAEGVFCTGLLAVLVPCCSLKLWLVGTLIISPMVILASRL